MLYTKALTPRQASTSSRFSMRWFPLIIPLSLRALLIFRPRGSAFGRYSAGHLSDHIGRFNTTLLTLALTLLVVFALWLPTGHHVARLYAFAPLFGFGSGSIISLAPVCFGQLCKADQYGQYYGTSYSVVSFATLICIPVGGALLPAVGAQGFVAFFGGMVVLSLISFVIARWACLGYRWKWTTIV